ncbi:TetR/AcrR family transcriptional regulator [Kitasatospora sp. NPDC057223]|uniref:TetR/AcrR family transcriptional regulator n=1 Tax=Kitasatospora sp. NPDC057223 TaxID=3346055 RepID=UPI00362E0D5A
MAQKRLTRELVLVTALALVDRNGLGALTMRGLAAELGVEPMAVYRYAPGKDALLDGLIEVLLGEVEAALAAGPRHGGWRQQLHEGARAVYRAALAHPQVVPLLATRPLAVPLARRSAAVLRLNERILTLLGRAGLDDRTTLALYRAMLAWLLGYLLVELRAMVVDPDEEEPAIRLGLHHLPSREYPRLRALAPAMADHDAEAEIAAGLDALIDRHAGG